MEKLTATRQLGLGLLVVVGSLVMVGCSKESFNPANSVTHDADMDAGATKEILANYPDARNIKVTHADDNPNYMSWEIGDDMVCTAVASMTQNRGKTPGQLISEPYCRSAVK